MSPLHLFVLSCVILKGETPFPSPSPAFTLSSHLLASLPLPLYISLLAPFSFQVYDAVGHAPARYWLLRRSTPAPSSNASDAKAVPEPGDPYRYLLPEDTTGLTQVAVLHDELAHLSTLQTTYSMLQASLTELCRFINLMLARVCQMC